MKTQIRIKDSKHRDNLKVKDSEGKGSPNRCVLSAIRRWAKLSEAGCPGGECSRDEGADKRAGGVEEEGGGGRPERTGGWIYIERFYEFRARETTEGFEGEGGAVI